MVQSVVNCFMDFSCLVLSCSHIFIVFSSSLINLLGEERADCSAYRGLVCLFVLCLFFCVFFCST